MLNEKEKIFLQNVLSYSTYKEAADKLGIPEEDLKEKIKKIYVKMGVFNKIQACIMLYKLENILK